MRAIRKIVDDNLTLNPTTPVEGVALLERLAAVYEQRISHANRLLYFYVLFVIFYLVRIVGLRLDIVFSGHKIFEVPYGIFFFCLVSQVAYAGSVLLNTEARFYQRYIEIICDKLWPGKSEVIKQGYIGKSSFGHAIFRFFESQKSDNITRILYLITAIPVSLSLAAIILSPIIAGIYFLADWKNQIGDGDLDLQYYSILTSTICCTLVTILSHRVYYMDRD